MVVECPAQSTGVPSGHKGRRKEHTPIVDVALFRKENRKIVRKIDASQQNFLLQNEDVIGINLEARPHVVNFFVRVLALAMPIISLVKLLEHKRSTFINHDNYCNKPLIFGGIFETRRVYFLLTSQSKKDKEGKGWRTQEAQGLGLIVPYITSVHTPFTITLLCDFNQRQRKLENQV